MVEKEYEYKKVYIYNCWRDKPNECRYGWESMVEEPANSVKCPKCGSFHVTVKVGEKKVEKKPEKKVENK